MLASFRLTSNCDARWFVCHLDSGVSDVAVLAACATASTGLDGQVFLAYSDRRVCGFGEDGYRDGACVNSPLFLCRGDALPPMATCFITK